MKQSTRDRCAVELTAIIEEWIENTADVDDWPYIVPDLAAIMAAAALQVVAHMAIFESTLQSQGMIKDET